MSDLSEKELLETIAAGTLLDAAYRLKQIDDQQKNCNPDAYFYDVEYYFEKALKQLKRAKAELKHESNQV